MYRIESRTSFRQNGHIPASFTSAALTIVVGLHICLDQEGRRNAGICEVESVDKIMEFDRVQEDSSPERVNGMIFMVLTSGR
jgi:hypothetical protein